MHAKQLIDRMERFSGTLSAAAAGLPDEDACFKPADGAWSILEIVCHLVDEETADFRARLRSTLLDPGATWQGIDPEGWAVQRRYNERDLSETLQRFDAERRNSIEWLRGLADPDWSQACQHPRIGPLSAGDLLAAWCAHDALHLRQIAKRLYQLSQRDAGNYSVDYAGTWRA